MHLFSKSSTVNGLLYAGWRSRCKAFLARKAALSPWSKAWARKLSYDKRQSTFIHELEILWWFPTWAVLRSLANARKCQLEDFCEKERYESYQSNGRAQQTPSARFGKEKRACSAPTTRFHERLAFEKPLRSVPETWGRMYDVLALRK